MVRRDQGGGRIEGVCLHGRRLHPDVQIHHHADHLSPHEQPVFVQDGILRLRRRSGGVCGADRPASARRKGSRGADGLRRRALSARRVLKQRGLGAVRQHLYEFLRHELLFPAARQGQAFHGAVRRGVFLQIAGGLFRAGGGRVLPEREAEIFRPPVFRAGVFPLRAPGGHRGDEPCRCPVRRLHHSGGRICQNYPQRAQSLPIPLRFL